MESYEPAPVSKRIITGFIAAFIVLFALTVTLPHGWIPQPATLLANPLDWLALKTADLLGARPGTDRSESDSPAMMAQVTDIVVLSLIASVPLQALLRRPKLALAVRTWLPRLCMGILAWQLLHYGFNEVFKWQFYRPEPNIQYTRITDLSPDILYWTTMGVSRGYSIFLGSAELIAAALLFFRRTRLAGALLALGVLGNVLAVNLAFDITVKLLSAYLILLALVVIRAYRRRLGALFGSAYAPEPEPADPVALRIAKPIVLALLCSDALLPYLRSGIFNDDAAGRPPLHGAYEVLPASPANAGQRRVFIHRRGYLILQDSLDHYRDYTLGYDSQEPVLWLSRPEYRVEYGLDFDTTDSGMTLRGTVAGDSLNLILKKLPLRY